MSVYMCVYVCNIEIIFVCITMYKSVYCVRTVLLFFSSIFMSLWERLALVQILRGIFLFTSYVFDVESCILEYFKTTVLVAIIWTVCTAIPLSSFCLTQPYKTLLWWFIQTYGGCFCQAEICLAFFSQRGIRKRYLWSFFLMFIVYPDLGTDTTQQACQCHEAHRQTSPSQIAVFYKKLNVFICLVLSFKNREGDAVP